jgi:hypothetical protein
VEALKRGDVVRIEDPIIKNDQIQVQGKTVIDVGGKGETNLIPAGGSLFEDANDDGIYLIKNVSVIEVSPGKKNASYVKCASCNERCASAIQECQYCNDFVPEVEVSCSILFSDGYSQKRFQIYSRNLSIVVKAFGGDLFDLIDDDHTLGTLNRLPNDSQKFNIVIKSHGGKNYLEFCEPHD